MMSPGSLHFYPEKMNQESKKLSIKICKTLRVMH